MSRPLVAAPIERDYAQDFVGRHHRHSRPPVGDRYRLAVGKWAWRYARRSRKARARLRRFETYGVAVVGRPTARGYQDGWTLEVLRVCTDATKEPRNACSFLYARARKVGALLGFRRVVTYTLDEEEGASLRADGWRQRSTKTRGREWSCKSRPRQEAASTSDKACWLAPGSSWRTPPAAPPKLKKKDARGPVSLF